jgi:hypothetical protein
MREEIWECRKTDGGRTTASNARRQHQKPLNAGLTDARCWVDAYRDSNNKQQQTNSPERRRRKKKKNNI